MVDDDGLPIFAVGDGVRLDTDDGLERLHSWILQNDLDVLAIDTLRRVHRLRENEADDMAKIEAAIKTLQRRRAQDGRPLTVILVHHAPKPRRDAANEPETMARGSGDILAGVDAGLYLRKGRDRGQVVIESSKNRWSAAPAPFVVEIEGSECEIRVSYRGAVDEIKGQLKRAEEFVLGMLRQGGGPTLKSELVERGAAAKPKLAQRTIERACDTLEERGHIVKGSRGPHRTYDLTDAGLIG